MVLAVSLCKGRCIRDATRVLPWLFRWGRLQRANRYRVAFVAEGDLRMAQALACSAKATLTTNSTLNTAIVATTLRIDALGSYQSYFFTNYLKTLTIGYHRQ